MLPFARWLIIIGIVLVISGGLLFLLAKNGIEFGQLPGDIQFKSANTTCILALGTSILLSIFLTLAINIVVRFLN